MLPGGRFVVNQTGEGYETVGGKTGRLVSVPGTTGAVESDEDFGGKGGIRDEDGE